MDNRGRNSHEREINIYTRERSKRRSNTAVL